MKIIDVRVETFTYKSGIVRDSEGHTLPAIIARARQTLIEHNLTPRPAQSSLPAPAGTIRG